MHSLACSSSQEYLSSTYSVPKVGEALGYISEPNNYGQQKENQVQLKNQKQRDEEKNQADPTGKSQTMPGLKTDYQELGIYAKSDWKPLKCIEQGNGWHENKLGARREWMR